MTRVLLVAKLLAVGSYLDFTLHILLRLHESECMAKPFVLDDGGVADTLVLAEGAVGKRASIAPNLQL
jgi:hypothetical protein